MRDAGHVFSAPLRYAACTTLLAITSAGQGLPPGFQESVVYSGLSSPTAVRFAPDGRVFVSEKSGLIKVYDDVDDPTPTIFADLTTNVYDAWDRGLLGLAIHPAFPEQPYVYVLYAFDAPIGGTAPVWGDQCPEPPGFTNQGCVVSGRLSRLEAAGDVMTGSEAVMIEDWCQQFPSHSIGDLHFGMDGALYATAGDGASFNYVDNGQVASTCIDPANEGGALRSQDIETSGDPVTLNGTAIRVDPATGMALPDNPLFGGGVADDDRIVAYGLRNPFRFTIRPGTNELWIGDVGWNDWEEINRVVDPVDALIENLGWPCYEGAPRQDSYDFANYPICENLYTSGTATAPYYAYLHGGDSSAITGLAFYPGGPYPVGYDDALFFADFSQGWIRVMFSDLSGDPDPSNIITFRTGVLAVDVQIGPDGNLYYVDIGAHQVRRVEYFAANTPPVAVLSADVTNGPSPLLVQFDGSASFDDDAGDTLSFAWDLDGDGEFDDAAVPAPQWTYTISGSIFVQLEVTDNHGASDVANRFITVDNGPPVVNILTPPESFLWSVGDAIPFAGQAFDPDTGPLPASALDWEIVLLHCSHDDPMDCHEHSIVEVVGTAAGFFSAIDHEYPSLLELRLTATDQGIADWWDSDWATRRTLTFDNQAQGNLHDFPVLVRLDPTRIDYTDTAADGSDLRFVDADATTVLAHEIESWNPGGTSFVWVGIPTINGGATNDFVWMYHGNPAAIDAQNAAAVWSNYVGVWHMDATLSDSTSFANHGTNQGTSAAAGHIANARAFDGFNDYVDLGNNASLALAANLSIEAWIQIANPDQGSNPRVLSKKAFWDAPDGYNLEYKPADNNLTCVGSGSNFARADGIDLDTQWHCVAASIFDGTGTMYVDGIDQTTDPTLSAVVAGTQALVLGRISGGGESYFGNMDEVRLSNVSRSPDWMAAQYRSMADSFITFGPSTHAGALQSTSSVTLEPLTSHITLASQPPGLQLVIYTESEESPAIHEVIVNAVTTISAPSPQVLNGQLYEFVSWSDGGAASHNITISEFDQTLTATFRPGVPAAQANRTPQPGGTRTP